MMGWIFKGCDPGPAGSGVHTVVVPATQTVTLDGVCTGPGRHPVWHAVTVTDVHGPSTVSATVDCPACGAPAPVEGVA